MRDGRFEVGLSAPRRRTIALSIVLIWAAWSVVTLRLASAAALLPSSVPSPWPADRTAKAPPLARWDSGWYLEIAETGYRFDPTQQENNIHFFPLYPMVVRFAARLTGLPTLDVGIACSLLFLLAALLLLADLFERLGSTPGLALLAVGAMLAFPTAYYFASFYTESLFLLTTVAALWAARRGFWWLAALAGAAAALTRLNGAIIAVPLAWLAWESAGRFRQIGLRRVVAVAAPALAALGFAVWLHVRFGSPLLYLGGAHTDWPHRPTPIWMLPANVIDAWRSETGRPALFFEVGSLLLFSVLTVALFARRLLPEALYCAATLLMLLNSGSVGAMHRYVLPLFPAYLPLAVWLSRRPIALVFYFWICAGLGVTLMTRFVHWLWVA